MLVIGPQGGMSGERLRRELAAKTAKPVYSAEQAALEQLGMAEAEHFVRLAQEHLNAIRTEFNKILQQEKV